MNVNVERVFVMLVVFSFASTSINIFAARGGLLTQEEAIAISRNSKFVRSFFEREPIDNYVLEIHYLNRTQARNNRGGWAITWYIHPTAAPSSFAYVVTQWIYEDTGEIIDQGAISHP